MEVQVEHDELDEALRRCGSSWGAAQAHGMLSGKLAVAGAHGGSEWLQSVLEGTSASDALRHECETLLGGLYQATLQQLSERMSEFAPLLPGDAEAAAARTGALAHWCEGFLHGLVSADHGDELKRRLAAEPLADIIRDMLQITRAGVGDDDDGETNESAYAELVEYLRVACQLAYEELSEVRQAGGDS